MGRRASSVPGGLSSSGFQVEIELEELIDAGEGTVLALQTVTRGDPETGEVELRA